MLKIDNLALRVGERTLFTLGHLDLHSGIVALVGRNGSGKSTFIRTVLGEHNDYDGRIEINGRALHAWQKKDVSKEIAVVYSKPQLFGNHTVRDVLLLGRLPYQGMFATISESDELVVFRIAELLDIVQLLDQPFQILSDGEKQLVMIGRALVQDTPVLLMDEPGAFLDIVNRYRLVELMNKIAQESNKLILFSTHHIDLLSACCYKVLLIENGEVMQLDDTEHFEKQIKEVFSIQA